jgi:hypothetical protein
MLIPNDKVAFMSFGALQRVPFNHKILI